MRKFSWVWKKFWGYRYRVMNTNGTKQDFILYHRKIYNVLEWNNYFNKNRGDG